MLCRELDPFYLQEMRVAFYRLRTEGIIRNLHRLMMVPQIAQVGVPVEAIERGELIASQEELPYL